MTATMDLETLSKKRNSLYQFAFAAITAAMERSAQCMNQSLMLQFQAKVSDSCKKLDAISTLSTAMLVDMISDKTWIEEWSPVLLERGDEDDIEGRITTEAEDLHDCAVRTTFRAIAMIEWFHTVQHAAEKGNEPDFSKLKIDKTIEQALAENDPEMAVMIAIGEWLSAEASADSDPFQYPEPDMSELFGAIHRHMEPAVRNRVHVHLEILTALDQGVIDEKTAHARFHEVMPGIDKEFEKIRVNRGTDAVKAMRDEDGLNDPVKQLLKALGKDLKKRMGGKATDKVIAVNPESGEAIDIGGDDSSDEETE